MIYPVPALVIEGMEDTGKSTLCQALQDRLEAEGYKVQRFTPERLKDPDDLVGWYNSHFKMGLEIYRCQMKGDIIPLVDRSFITMLIYQFGVKSLLTHSPPRWLGNLMFGSPHLIFLIRENGIHAESYKAFSSMGHTTICLPEGSYCTESDTMLILETYKNRLKG